MADFDTTTIGIPRGTSSLAVERASVTPVQRVAVQGADSRSDAGGGPPVIVDVLGGVGWHPAVANAVPDDT
jgi:hypothetical protein